MKAKEHEDQDLVWSKKIGISPNLQNGVVPKYQRFYRRYLKPRLNKKHIATYHLIILHTFPNQQTCDWLISCKGHRPDFLGPDITFFHMLQAENSWPWKLHCCVYSQLPTPRKPAKVSPNISQNLLLPARLCSASRGPSRCLGKRCVEHVDMLHSIHQNIRTGFSGHVNHACYTWISWTCFPCQKKRGVL